MSNAASAQYGAPCPTCKAGAWEPCRALSSGRITDTHSARLVLQGEIWMSPEGDDA